MNSLSALEMELKFMSEEIRILNEYIKYLEEFIIYRTNINSSYELYSDFLIKKFLENFKEGVSNTLRVSHEWEYTFYEGRYNYDRYD